MCFSSAGRGLASRVREKDTPRATEARIMAVSRRETHPVSKVIHPAFVRLEAVSFLVFDLRSGPRILGACGRLQVIEVLGVLLHPSLRLVTEGSLDRARVKIHQDFIISVESDVDRGLWYNAE